jgi:quercetin dioxygenase-like cupin family protein
LNNKSSLYESKYQKHSGQRCGKGDGVTTCPVTGEPVNKEIKFGFFGRTIYFCCANCRDTVVKNPELFLKPTSAEGTMNVLKLQTEIGEGKDKQVDTLFEGAKRKVVQITLRNRAVLSAHKAPEPITIQCVAGQGVIRVGEKGESVDLRPRRAADAGAEHHTRD